MNKEIMHSRAAKVTAAGFTAALAANLDATDLSAGIISIGFTPNSVAWTSSSTVRAVGMTANSAAIGGFNQWNDSVGKTLAFDASGLQSWRSANAGELIKKSTFVGDQASWGHGTSSTGTVYQAFRTLSGNLGWFAWNLGGIQGAITYDAGQYGDAGESLTVGAADGGDDEGATPSSDGVVPEPGHVGLSLLALGAVGIRRRRSMRSQAV
ncbi:MAG: PEP-CTERM sorting domain-containing protein [Rubripirellula sp.]|nr:PEP-CTERM sorting domain-containing protein [Rubripirellula sp.]